jgi:acyl carrier protein
MTIRTIEGLANLFKTRLFSLEKLVNEKTGCQWDYTAKTFGQMGVDELDVVELVMDIEKIFDCVITDDLLDVLYGCDPNSLLVSVIRQRKLEELGI